MFLRAISLVAYMAVAATQSANAQTSTVNTSVSPQQMSGILTKAGYRAELADIKTSEKGLFGQIVKTTMDGKGVFVYFFDCNDTNCKSFQITLGLAPESRFTVDFANRWNRVTRFVRGMVAANGNFVMQYDVEVSGGTTDACLTNSVNLFNQVLTDFDKFQ
jgi:putative sensory transduction regulator